MIVAIVSLMGIGLALGALLGAASKWLAVEENPIEAELQAMLPGSQCGQCGYVGCAQAAAALARGEAPVTLCPPGGRAVAEALAKKLGVKADLSAHEEKVPQYACIRPDLCFGCTRCMAECNVDAIIGATKQMHDVIADLCHGCGKCALVCPTQGIEMRPVPATVSSWHWPKPRRAASAH
ncbi:RnfABCDGE type electron transport complex subunit B [Thauera sp. 2A1]|uniref:RnfABCDGE type electron transport complex subunit B n=1 Tax=Thauera sp. 2A1 TaxID=2570191 RepID=UPI001291799E|nr:RnfABCDGE type electron transport complex subunit B [Thauera sp. 2A1]KAI5914535.1 RnfABCDGE type electron transport complex subunit B [Thauera sp. 2A1]